MANDKKAAPKTGVADEKKGTAAKKATTRRGAGEGMTFVTLKRTYGYGNPRKDYGPGEDVEVPMGLANALGQTGRSESMIPEGDPDADQRGAGDPNAGGVSDPDAGTSTSGDK